MADHTDHDDIIFPPAAHQDKVNKEMFRAIELLGRKLERVESERDALARRLGQIESAASVDDATGKLYLPVVVENTPAQKTSTSWMLGTTVLSVACALGALAVVLLNPAPGALTEKQLAALDRLASPQLASAAAPAFIPLNPVQTGDDVNVAQFSESGKALIDAVTAKANETHDTLDAPAADVAETNDNNLTPAELSAIEPAAGAVDAEALTTPLKPVTDIARDTRLPQKLQTLEAEALAGKPEAQHDLATLYAAGDIAPKDYPRAIEWFTIAAQNGVPNAAYNLAVMYQQGLGVDKDAAKAVTYYAQAAKAGHAEAMYNLGLAYIDGTGTNRDIGGAVVSFKQAANAGVPQAAYNLGVIYESSLLGAPNAAKAADWYRVAAEEGHAEAKSALARLTGSTADIAGIEPAAGEEASGEGDETPASEILPAEQPAAAAKADDSDMLRQIQHALVVKGELPVEKATGYMTPQTADVIRHWQQKLGLVVDGKPSEELLDKIKAAPASRDSIIWTKP